MPAPKTILVYIEHSEAGAEFLREAASLALAREAQLVALAIGLQPPPTFAGFPDVPLRYDAELIEEVREGMKAALAWARELLEPTGCSFEVRATTVPAGAVGSAFARQARYADLSIFPRSDRMEGWHHLVDATLFESGKPVVIWPRGTALGRIGARVAIGWDGGAEAACAAYDAVDHLAAASDVRIVIVDPTVGPGAHGEEPGADIATGLARHGLPVTVDAIPSGNRSVAEAFLRHAQAMDADLLVVGAYGHSRLSEIILGGPTRDLMDMADRPLMMAH